MSAGQVITKKVFKFPIKRPRKNIKISQEDYDNFVALKVINMLITVLNTAENITVGDLLE